MTDNAMPTIVIPFGGSVSNSTELFLIELDGALNRETVYSSTVGGMVNQEKTQFYPDDTEINFYLHFDTSKYTVLDVKSTIGQVQMGSWVTRDHEEEVLFEGGVDEKFTLSHIPIKIPDITWFGKAPVLSRNGRYLSVNTAPCIGLASYQFNAWSGKLYLPTTIELEDDEEFPLAIIAHIEAKKR